MVMQFQELENPIQIRPCHSPMSSGFAMEMMSVKPAKGKRLFTGARGEASATGLRNMGDFCLRLQLQISVNDGSSRTRRLG